LFFLVFFLFSLILILLLQMYLGLDRGHFLSPHTQCLPFSSLASGYSRAEGCALFVLKRLSSALAENDRIYGVIRGVEVNQSGRAHSITYPHAETQAQLFRNLLSAGNMERERVNVVEAHGTGTQAGDPNEMQSIRAVLAIPSSSSTPGRALHVTSIKANVGHLEAASGGAGLAKVLLMLKHRFIPPQISLSPQTLNPKIAPLATDNTVISPVGLRWAPGVEGTLRVAVVNNFGAAGGNSAVLVEEWVARPRSESANEAERGAGDDGEPLVFGMSAKTPEALQELRERYLAFLARDDDEEVLLRDIAYTMTARRQLFGFRIAVVAKTREELVRQLRGSNSASTSTSSSTRNANSASTSLPAPPTNARSTAELKETNESANGVCVWVFGGQGGQYVGMGRALYERWEVVRACVEEAEELLKGAGFVGVKAVLLGGGDDDDDANSLGKMEEANGLSKMEEAEAFQTAIMVLECALARLWGAWGLIPAAVIGHSCVSYSSAIGAS
jgi:acyl transferase domain-containing protein